MGIAVEDDLERFLIRCLNGYEWMEGESECGKAVNENKKQMRGFGGNQETELGAPLQATGKVHLSYQIVIDHGD